MKRETACTSGVNSTRKTTSPTFTRTGAEWGVGAEGCCAVQHGDGAEPGVVGDVADAEGRFARGGQRHARRRGFGRLGPVQGARTLHHTRPRARRRMANARFVLVVQQRRCENLGAMGFLLNSSSDFQEHQLLIITEDTHDRSGIACDRTTAEAATSDAPC